MQRPILRPRSRDVPNRIKRSRQCHAGFCRPDPAQAWTATVLSGAGFRHVSGRSALLARTALPEMRRLFAMVRRLDFMVLLDADAMIPARCADETHPSISRRVHREKGRYGATRSRLRTALALRGKSATPSCQVRGTLAVLPCVADGLHRAGP